MAAEDFFSRWSQRRPQADAIAEPAAAPRDQAPVAPVAPEPPPTLDQVAGLTLDSDYSRFLANDVDETVKRSAMKKLFAAPHFNVMDGLDIYIGDYSQPDPIPPEMLAALNHAKALLDPLAQLKDSLLQLTALDPEDPPADSAAPADTGAGGGQDIATPGEASLGDTSPGDASLGDTSPDTAPDTGGNSDQTA